MDAETMALLIGYVALATKCSCDDCTLCAARSTLYELAGTQPEENVVWAAEVWRDHS